MQRFFRSDQDIRKQQINTLKIFNDNVKELVADHEYEVPFTAGNNDLRLLVTLSKDFPREKPNLQVVPNIVHPWLNSEGFVTSAPGLLNFTVHSDLGRVVQAVIREFQRNPPPLISSVDKKSEPISVPMNYPDVTSIANSKNKMCSSAFPELQSLPLDELEFLNENEDCQEEFIDELPPMKELENILNDTVCHIEELAEANLSKKETLSALRKSIDQQIEGVTKLAFENERLNVVYQNLSDQYSPRNIQERLRLAAEKAEEESEKIAEKFLQGDMDVDKFLNEFLKVRTHCQTRKTKYEKLSNQLDSLEKAGF